jgi:hypothetical protein
MWESFGDNYVEAVATALPLQRAAVFLIGFVLSIFAVAHDYKSVTESIVRMPLDGLFNMNAGWLSGSTILNLAFGVFAAILAAFGSHLALRVVFLVAAKSVDYDKRIADSLRKNALENVNTIQERKEAIEFVEAAMEEPRSKLRKLNASAEALIGIGFALLISAYWGNILDTLLGGVVTLVAFLIHVRSVQIFLSETLALIMVKNQLLGKPAPPSPLN